MTSAELWYRSLDSLSTAWYRRPDGLEIGRRYAWWTPLSLYCVQFNSVHEFGLFLRWLLMRLSFDLCVGVRSLESTETEKSLSNHISLHKAIGCLNAGLLLLYMCLSQKIHQSRVWPHFWGLSMRRLTMSDDLTWPYSSPTGVYVFSMPYIVLLCSLYERWFCPCTILRPTFLYHHHFLP